MSQDFLVAAAVPITCLIMTAITGIVWLAGLWYYRHEIID